MIKKICRVSGKEFEITSDDLEFYTKMGIISMEDYKKLKSREISDCIGLPTLCPEERQRRRLSWRNERSLYKRKCDGTGRDLVGVYPIKTPFPIYSHKYFFSDKWNALDYGQDFDFSRSFFEQFAELQQKVPRIINFAFSNENAEYGNLASWNKDCYMCIEADNNRGCLYCSYTFRCVDCADCTHLTDSELCANCIDCHKCYDLKFSIDCKNCHESLFLKNCVGCSNCFGCVNLRQKQYYWLNKKLTKNEYEKKLAQLNLGNWVNKNQFWNNFIKFTEKFPAKFLHGLKNEEVLGDYIYNSKNAQYCFDVSDLRDCKYCCNLERSKDAMDIDIYGGLEGTELVYECHAVGRGAFNVAFGNMVYQQLQNCWYSDTCAFSKDLFGCISVYHKQYCILNKQYTKEEYEKTSEKIIAHMKKTSEWGEFFPIELSPFAYNETVAQEYFPLTPNPLAPLSGGTDQQVFHQNPNLNFKYKWKEKISRDFRPATIEEIPDDIKDVDDSICKEILACNNPLNPPCQGGDNSCSPQKCGKNYQIQKPELRFYRKMNLPIPRKCPDCRHADRMKLRNPRTLFERSCADCGKDIQTTFAPDRPEKVLCEECYFKIIN